VLVTLGRIIEEHQPNELIVDAVKQLSSLLLG
jgi:hypothetical protein